VEFVKGLKVRFVYESTQAILMEGNWVFDEGVMGGGGLAGECGKLGGEGGALLAGCSRKKEKKRDGWRL
jgi:hypothetical protein